MRKYWNALISAVFDDTFDKLKAELPVYMHWGRKK